MKKMIYLLILFSLLNRDIAFAQNDYKDIGQISAEYTDSEIFSGMLRTVYKFSTTDFNHITIDNFGSDLQSTYIELHRVDGFTEAKPLHSKAGSFDVPASPDKRHGSLTYNWLSPGSYYIIIYAEGEIDTNSNTLITNVKMTTATVTIGPPVVWTRPGQGQMMGDAILLGEYSDSFFYTDARNLDYYKNIQGNSGNDVFYRFTLEKPMSVTIHHRGSAQFHEDPIPTTIMVYKEGLYGQQAELVYISSMAEDPYAFGASLTMENLEPTTYHIVCERNFGNVGAQNEQGILVTTFEATYYPGYSWEDAIYVGNYADDFTYSDIQKVSNLPLEQHVNPTVYYKLDISSMMNITVSHCGISNTVSEIRLLDENGHTLERRTFQESSVLCSGNQYSTFLSVDELYPGTYYIASIGGDLIKTNISGRASNPQGNTMENAMNVGRYETGFCFSGIEDARVFTNNYPGNLKDIFYKLTLEYDMDLSVYNCGSDADSTLITVIKEDGTVVGNSETHKGESCYISTQGTFVYRDLPAGVYYIISEGVSSDGMLVTYIEGTSAEHIPEEKELSLSNDKNYTMTITPTVALTSVDDRPRVDQTVQTIHYYDGLGRLEEVVQRGFSPKKRDIVSYKEYDAFGTDGKQWLPALGQGNGEFTGLDEVKLESRFLYKGDPAPFSEAVYDSSSLRLITEVYGAGQAWHENDKSVKTNYHTNIAGNLFLDCALYQINSLGNLTRNGNYEAYSLYITEIKSEDDNTGYEFKNNSGQVVLNRQINNGEKYDTYYVYDDFGNLCYVLPPLAVDKQTIDLSENSAAIRQYAYLYRYDHYNRCVAKKLPGCDWIYYVYDKADQLIFTQNGEQRTKDEWMFSIPDVFGRIVLTGLCKDTLSIADKVIKAVYTSSGSYKRYDIQADGVSQQFAEIPLIFSAYYYDNYDFRDMTEIPTSETEYTAESGYGAWYAGDYTEVNKHKNKGLLTGTMTAQMKADGTLSSTYLYSVMYYDNKGCIVQTKSNNHLTGGIEKDYIAYNFTGQPTKSKYIHSATDQPDQIGKFFYTYDHAGRLLTSTYQHNNGETILLAENMYDELGRLKASKKGNSERLTSEFGYNVRSWITAINNDLFKEALGYTFSGNIDCMDWQQSQQKHRYEFEYDDLSRLLSADYSIPATEGKAYSKAYSSAYGASSGGGDMQRDYSTRYSYDKHGNISSLIRYGKLQDSSDSFGVTDELAMGYTGNQLTGIAEVLPMVPNPGLNRLDNAVNQLTQYTYNKNGALVKDSRKGITEIRYNSLNLPQQIDIKSSVAEARNEYLYSAGGQKLRVTHRWNPDYDPTTETAGSVDESALREEQVSDYVGNYIYEDGVLKRVLIQGGYYDATDGKYYFYITDHLGNNRLVTDQNGEVTQENQYYPFGIEFAKSESEDEQPYKYNGKELDSKHGLNLYDYSARYYEPAIGRFTTMDPLAEKYYSISPYAYCVNNPVRFVDPDGKKIKPAGTAELSMIHNTLPHNTRQYVRFDKNGYINKDLINSHNSESLNFNFLKEIVNSDITMEVLLDDKFVFREANGNIGSTEMSHFPYDPMYPDDIDSTGDTMGGTSTGETGFLGKTLFPDREGVQNSPNDNIIIIVHKDLLPQAAAEIYSHEANGHGLLYLRNGGDHKGASHQVGEGLKELNRTLLQMIIDSKKETIINMRY